MEQKKRKITMFFPILIKKIASENATQDIPKDDTETPTKHLLVPSTSTDVVLKYIDHDT